MSITNYTELQAAVANWLDRTDLTARIPEFIALAEKKMTQRLTEFPRTSFSATGVTDDYVFTVPYLAIRGVSLNDGAGGTYNRPLTLLTSEEYQQWMQARSTVGGAPAAVFVDTDHQDWVDDTGVTLRFWPPLSTDAPANVAIDYIKKPESLSGTVATNEVLKASPMAYLYGALSEAATYLQQPENVWAPQFEAEVDRLNKWAQRQHFAGPRKAKLPVVFG